MHIAPTRTLLLSLLFASLSATVSAQPHPPDPIADLSWFPTAEPSPEDVLAHVDRLFEHTGALERAELFGKRARHGEERIAEWHEEVWIDAESRWEDGIHAQYEYDSEGRITSWSERQWYENRWHNYLRRFSTYNEDGLVAEVIDQTGTENRWANDHRYETFYETGPSGPRLSESIHQDWTEGGWQNSAQAFFDYDEAGLLLELVIETQPSSDMGPTRRSLYEYNDAGLLVTLTDQEWSPMEWVNTYRRQYTYDADGNPVGHTLQVWSGDTWENYSECLHAYVDGLQIESRLRFWTEGEWVNHTRKLYTYAADGQQTEWLKQEWADGAWVDEGRYSHTYDGDGKRVGSLMEWMIGGQWLNRYRSLYIYEEATAGEASPSIAKDAFAVYPNPVHGRATVSFTAAQGGTLRLDVFDVLGRRVLSEAPRTLAPGEHAFELNLSSLPAGIYIVRAGGAVSKSQRVVVMD